MKRSQEKQGTRSFERCTIDNPDDFYVVQHLRSDGELIDYLCNLTEMFKRYRDDGRENHVCARTCAWRSEVIKKILNDRGATVPDIYDSVFGYEPPVQKRKITRVTQDQLQDEVRFAEKQLREAKARARAAVAQLAHDDTEDQTACDQLAAEDQQFRLARQVFEEESISETGGGEEV